MELKDKHVFITGGGKRLGRALAEACLTKGARVTAHSFQTPLDFSHSHLQSVRGDLRQIERLPKLINQAEKNFGPTALLVNSASDFYATPSNECTDEQWDALFTLNLKAPFFLAQACEKSLRAQRGCVINLCDIHVAKPLKRFAPYAASKGGLWTLTRELAAEWAPDVRVNSISPGAVLPPDGFTAQQTERAARRSLFGRIGSARDIVEAAFFLVGNEYITGFDLKVDGGASL